MFKPQNDFTYDYSTATVDKQIPAREAMFILRRDAVCPLIYFNCNTGGAAWAYNWNSKRSGTALFPVQGGLNFLDPQNATDVGVAGYAPHGTTQVAMKSRLSDRRYIWIDSFGGSGTVTFQTCDNAGNVINVPATTAILIKAYYWNGVEEVQAGSAIIAAGSNSVVFTPVSRGGYIRFDLFNTEFVAPVPGVSIQNVRISSTGTCGNWCHISINNLANIAQNLTAVRNITSTLKVTNASAPGFAAGVIYDADVYNGQPWQTLATGSAAVGLLQTVQTRPANKGYYGFCRVEDLDDFEMTSQMSVTNLGATNAGFPLNQQYGDLDQEAPYKVVTFILPPPGTFPSDRFVNIELSSVIEGMGNNDVVEPELPIASPEQWEAALLVFSSLPSGYENPTHWRDILAAIGKVGSSVTPEIADYLRSVQAGHPLVVAASQFAGNVALPILTAGFRGLEKLKRKKK